MVQEQLLPYYVDDVLEKISQQECSSASGLRFFFDVLSQLWTQSLKLWAQHWLRMQLSSIHEAPLRLPASFPRPLLLKSISTLLPMEGPKV